MHCLFYPSDDEYQEIQDIFPSTNYGEKFPLEIMVEIPNSVTLTLQNVKLLEETPDTSNGVKYAANFP